MSSNVGLGKALNEGLKHCTYDWVLEWTLMIYAYQTVLKNKFSL
ncbi:hypothetical protein [Proteus mirabilis]|nr:hypothetical protein [Proteus mirabilis]